MNISGLMKLTTVASVHTNDLVKIKSSKNEEEELGIEFNEMLVSLPKGRGWRIPYLYRYEGYWYQEKELTATISFQRHFQAQDGDLILASILRSGTIWLKALAFALTNRKSFEYIGYGSLALLLQGFSSPTCHFHRCLYPSRPLVPGSCIFV